MRSITVRPTTRASISPIVAGAALGVAGVFLGLPSALLLAFSIVLATAGVALIIARPPEQPAPTVEASVALEQREPLGPAISDRT